MEKKHTPGPWEATKVNWDRTVIRHALRGDAHIPGYLAEVNNIGNDYDGNTKLIVAAPDLLSALRVARQALADYLPAHRNEVTDAAIAAADAAIARATGHDG